MTMNGSVATCPVKQAIKKYVREVPCPRSQPKGRQDAPCSASDCKKLLTRDDKCAETCPKKPPKRVCGTRRTLNNVYEAVEQRSTSPKGCPKCEENRIQKLECEVFELRREIEHMKHDRKEAEKALQKAILQSACALGGRFRSPLPGSIEKLLNSSNSDDSTCTFQSNAVKNGLPVDVQPCGVKQSKKRHDIGCCESCCTR